MRRYEVGTVKEGADRYYFVREKETFAIEPLTAKYLKLHYIESNRSPNTVRRAAYALCFYLEYLNEKQMGLTGPYDLPFDEQFQHFTASMRKSLRSSMPVIKSGWISAGKKRSMKCLLWQVQCII